MPQSGSEIQCIPNIPLERRKIPSSGESLPVVGIGTHLTFDARITPVSSPTFRTVLERFVALGGGLIDTSPMYGSAETVVGRLAAESQLTKQLFWATKIFTTGKAAGIQQMEESTRRLGQVPLDLVQIHNLIEWRVHLETLETWKAAGRIRYIGITHYHPGALSEVAEVMRDYPLDFVQIPYNIATREAEKEVLPLAAERGIAVIANLPFGHGALLRTVQGRPLPRLALSLGCRDWASFLLKFVLAHPTVTCVIPATADPIHLESDLNAGRTPFPNTAQRNQMISLIAQF